ncbi:hypothetical protein AI2795V1_4708 (plasmid) [Serratia marcescens]|uniref:hypothetical protein n=1 Tax=Serratia marcescens TaxID=615 RepID=UPI001D768A79|nr:hypothetical protein [Serratia marcescens]CAE7797982.1 hypothetical protein AI2795V1_4708 [Serratia marcescens]CAH3929848.1 hypothetical protein AI2795V1_4708 [Serratia marcescens]
MLDLSPGMQGFLGGTAAIAFPLIFNLGKEFYFDWRKRKAERAYISVQLIFLLDKFVARCADVSWDSGYDQTEQKPDDLELKDQASIPTFDMSSVKGEHKYLKPEMLSRLHSIEIRLNQANEALNDPDEPWLYGDGRWMYYEKRRELYSQVGAYAASIAKDLRTEFKIKTTHGWEPSERIQRSIQDLEEIKTSRAERIKLRKAERERIKAEEAQSPN